MLSPIQILQSMSKVSFLLLFFPVVLFLQFTGASGWPIFFCSSLAILGTVVIIGKAVEELALYYGPMWGGLLNATFGNVTEVIIALFAIYKGINSGDAIIQGKMFNVVRASIVGSVIGNLLLILGMAMVYGGMKYKTQKISRMGAQANVGLLWVVVITLLVPTLIGLGAETPLDAKTSFFVSQISVVASCILILLYGLTLLFSLKTHKFLLRTDESYEEKPDWTKMTAAGMLFITTGIVAYLSEEFVASLETLIAQGAFTINEPFIGVVIVALVGNAAEGLVAVWVARENKMELSFQVAVGSCLQVGMLVVPIIVFASWMMGSLMPLSFSLFEMLSLFAAVIIASSSLQDGETNWFEGAMLLAVYIFFALVFWFQPVAEIV
jgi:Ca2+:H+ antiporter